MRIPTRAEIEALLESIPVGKAKGNRTPEKVAERNRSRRTKIEKFLDQTVGDDVRLRRKIVNDLESYQAWEVPLTENDNA